jgi:pimeloyl-ACP methyl ester carboxylesterase
LGRALDEADRPPAEWAPGYVPGFFAGPVAPEVVDEVVGIMCDVRPAGIKPMVRAFADADLRDMLGDISVPTLLLWGEQDVRAPRDVADELHARIPGAELVVLTGVGHMSNVEAPDRFNAAVRRFLRAIPD